MEELTPKSNKVEPQDATAGSARSEETVKAGAETTEAVSPGEAPKTFRPFTPPVKSVDSQKREPTPPNAEKFFSLQERFPLQVFEHESGWQKFSHLGPTFTSLAAL